MHGILGDQGGHPGKNRLEPVGNLDVTMKRIPLSPKGNHKPVTRITYRQFGLPDTEIAEGFH